MRALSKSAAHQGMERKVAEYQRMHQELSQFRKMARELQQHRERHEQVTRAVVLYCITLLLCCAGAENHT